MIILFLALNTNKTQYKAISKPGEWLEMINDDRYIIHDIDFSYDDVLQVYFSINTEMHDGDNDCSVPIAAFVTCQARLKLYDELFLLGDRVLYFDTDSIIFVSRPGEYCPKLGDFLGEFTNEIDPKEGDYIEEFVSGGPKNYAYKLNTGVTHCVVKGFSLNYIADQKINFDSLLDIVSNDELFNQTISVDQLVFARNKYTWSVETNITAKMYRFVYTKRYLLANLLTLPYGF